MNWRIVIRGLIVMGLFVLAGLALSQFLNTAWIDSHVRGKGLMGEFTYVSVGAVFIAAGLSRQFVTFLGGYAFGFLYGSVWGLLASVLGCVLAFVFGRFAGRALVAKRFAGRIQKIDRFIHENPFSMTLLLRLLPVGSNLLVNLAAGVSSVRVMPFVLGSALGYVPQTLVFALLGSGISIQPVMRTIISVLLFMASAVLGVFLYRRYRHGKTLDDTLERELEG